jgi:hypothetical protein
VFQLYRCLTVINLMAMTTGKIVEGGLEATYHFEGLESWIVMVF